MRGSLPSGAQVFLFPVVRPAEGLNIVGLFMKLTKVNREWVRCHPGLGVFCNPAVRPANGVNIVGFS